MYQLDRPLLKGLTRAIAATAAAAVLIVLLLDIDGWGTFAWSWAAPLLAQAAVASILAGLFLALLRATSGTLFRLFLSRLALLALLVVAAIAALPFLSILFDRSVDIYDVIQTAVLAVIWVFLTRPAQHLLKRFEPKSTSRALPPRRRSLYRPAPSATGTTAQAGGELYKNLLVKVMGNKDTAERLIERERWSAPPNASRDELIKRAIESWERDNR